jgi:microcystin-dependent protein
MDPFIGEIKLVPYNFAPRGWAFCDGSILSISQNTALFSLLGTMYGGNGTVTFALPDLRGRAAISPGQGPGLDDYSQGEQGGVETVVIDMTTMASHSHPLNVSSAPGTSHTPTGQFLAVAGAGVGMAYDPTQAVTMQETVISMSTGSSSPHDNHQPYLALNYIIALQGIFPSRQ